VGTDQNGLWLCHFVGNPQTLDVKPLTLFPSGEVLGLDANPAWREEVAVSNSKGTIRFFDIVDHVVDVRSPYTCDLLRCGALRCLAFHRTGLVLAGGSEKGQLLLISVPASQQYGDEGQHTCKARELSNTTVCKAQITHVQWSSVGDWLVVGASDTKVYLFCVAIDYERARENRPPEVEAQHVVMSVAKVLVGNAAPVTSVQFSACGTYLMSNSADNQILFWETSSGSRCSSALALRDVRWFEGANADTSNGFICTEKGGASSKGPAISSPHPWQCTLGWPVAALWCRGRFASRSDAPPAVWAVESAPGRAVCAFSDNTRQVCLMRFPALIHTTPVKGYHGHGLQATNLCWTSEEVLMTVQDGAMLQWHVEGDSFRYSAQYEGDRQQSHQNFDWPATEVSPSKRKQHRFFGTPAAPRATSRSASHSASPSTGDRDPLAWAPPSGPGTQFQRSDAADNGKLSGGSKLVTRATQTEEASDQHLSPSPVILLQDISDVGTCTENSAVSDTPTTQFTATVFKDEAAPGTAALNQSFQSTGSADQGSSKLPTGTVIWQPEQAAANGVVSVGASAEDTFIGSSPPGPVMAIAAQLSHTMLPPVPATALEAAEGSYVRNSSAPNIRSAPAPMTSLSTARGGSVDYHMGGPGMRKVPSVRAPNASTERNMQGGVATAERFPSAEWRGARSVPTAAGPIAVSPAHPGLEPQRLSVTPTPLQQRLSTAHSWRPAVICTQSQATQRLRSYSPSPERAALTTRAASPGKWASDGAAPSRRMTPRGEATPVRSNLRAVQVPSAPSTAPATPRVVRATSVPMLRGPPRSTPGTITSPNSVQGTSTPGTPRHSAFPMQTSFRPVEVVSYHASGGQARRSSRPSRVLPGAASAQVPLASGLYTAPPPPAALPQVVSSRFLTPMPGVSTAQAVPTAPAAHSAPAAPAMLAAPLLPATEAMEQLGG